MAEWNHVPPLPLKVNPLFQRPFKPFDVLAWYVGSWLPVTVNLCIVGLAFLSLWAFAPDLSRAALPGIWMGEVLLRNLVLISSLAGGLHLWFHGGAQARGAAQKYDPRAFPRKGRVFTFEAQLWDNVFWTLCSAVPIWSGFEILIWMAMANGWAPVTTFAETPIWFVLVFLLIPVWESFYFYWIHRLLHTKPFFRFHALHHLSLIHI